MKVLAKLSCGSDLEIEQAELGENLVMRLTVPEGRELNWSVKDRTLAIAVEAEALNEAIKAILLLDDAMRARPKRKWYEYF